MRNLGLAVGFVVLNAGDTATTLMFKSHGVQEANPVLAPLLELSPVWFATTKVAAGFIIAGLITLLPPDRRWAGWLVCFLYTAAVISNTLALLGY